MMLSSSSCEVYTKLKALFNSPSFSQWGDLNWKLCVACHPTQLRACPDPPKVSNVPFDPKLSRATGPQLWALCPNQWLATTPFYQVIILQEEGTPELEVVCGVGSSILEWSALVPKSLSSKQVLWAPMLPRAAKLCVHVAQSSQIKHFWLGVNAFHVGFELRALWSEAWIDYVIQISW